MSKVVPCALFLAAAGFIFPLTKLSAEPGNGLVFMPAPIPQDAATVGDDEDATDPDTQPATAFRTAVRHLFDEEKFSQLDEIAGEVRAQKSRFRGGYWKLHYIYGALEDPGSSTAVDAAWEAHIERLERWISNHPDSITPRVAQADAYLRFAWKARGSGYAYKVVPEGWKAFRERVQKAQEALEQARSLPTKDPEWYRAMQTVARAQGWDHKRAGQLLAEEIGVEPGYYYFDEAYADYLLPKWGGRPGDAEEFASTVADRIGGAEGDFTYFMVAVSVNCCRKQPEAPGISWERVKAGFASLEQLYGSTNFERNALAFMALRQGDREFAQQLFARIRDNWNKRVWRSKDNFESGKASLN